MTASAIQNRNGPAIGTHHTRMAVRKTAPGFVRQIPQQAFGFPPAMSADFLSLYTAGIDRAMEMENAWLSATVCINSCTMELYKDICSPIPLFSNHFELAAKLFANCADQQMHWFGIWLPRVRRRTVPVPSRLLEMESAVPAEMTEIESEVLEHSMDIAIGVCAA